MRNRSSFVIAVALALVACADTKTDIPAGPTPPSNGSGGGVGSGGSVQSESCSQAGATQSCCTTGTRVCGGAELLTWGPCLDAAGTVLSCCIPSEFTTCDAGAPPSGCTPGEFGSCDGGAPPDMTAPPANCVCKPNSYRWCDEPLASTEWQKQSCTAQGQWGPCMASAPPAGACANAGNGYDPTCCVSLGYCCQDGPNGPFLGMCASTLCN